MTAEAKPKAKRTRKTAPVQALVPVDEKPLTQRQQRALDKARNVDRVPRRGPLAWDPSASERRQVAACVAAGFTRPQIAAIMDKSEISLLRHCRRELETGDLIANSKISSSLFRKAMKGDVAAMIWWEKTRRGLSERQIVQHEGNADAPVVVKDALTAKEAAEQYRQQLG